MRSRASSSSASARAPTLHDERRAAAPQAAGQLGHEAEVRERRTAERAAAAVPGVADIGLRDERELPVAVERALRQSGGARREDDRDRPVGIGGKRRRHVTVDADVVQQVTDSVGGRVLVGRQHDPRRGNAEHGLALASGKPVVHARSDRAELRRRRRRQARYSGPGGSTSADHVARGDTPRHQAAGDFVGDAVESAYVSAQPAE